MSERVDSDQAAKAVTMLLDRVFKLQEENKDLKQALKRCETEKHNLADHARDLEDANHDYNRENMDQGAMMDDITLTTLEQQLDAHEYFHRIERIKHRLNKECNCRRAWNKAKDIEINRRMA